MISLSESVHVSLVGAAGAIAVAVIALVGNYVMTRETRRRNTLEHDAGRLEREQAESRLSGRLESIDAAVRHHTDILIEHIGDPDAHGG